MPELARAPISRRGMELIPINFLLSERYLSQTQQSSNANFCKPPNACIFLNSRIERSIFLESIFIHG